MKAPLIESLNQNSAFLYLRAHLIKKCSGSEISRGLFEPKRAPWILACFLAACLSGIFAIAAGPVADNVAPQGYVLRFNGKDLSGWKVPEGDGGHWKVLNGVIDYDAESQAKGDKNLWTDRAYRDFVLQVDWRLKEAPYINPEIPYILPDGSLARDIHGKDNDPVASGCGFRNPAARPTEEPDQYLVLAYRLRGDLWIPDGPRDAAGSPRRRHAAHPG
jgi:hypothetical protein